MEMELKIPKQISLNPYNRFLYALKATESKRQYPRRLEVFLNFMNVAGSTLEERLYNFHQATKSNTEWLQDSLIEFILFQKERVNRGEIVASIFKVYPLQG
jgi:hypothetical protein